MIKYIPESLLDELEELKDLWKFDEAMRIINWVLIDDPHNEDALLQVADIQYRKWEIGKASKAIDFFEFKKKWPRSIRIVRKMNLGNGKK